jgi:hypothetical protein
MEMSMNEQAQWHAHLQTPVLFNHHAPIEVESPAIQSVDLNGIMSTPRAALNQERVLILTPLRDAAPFLNKYFDLLSELTYPHELIDLAFLVGDSTDDTLAVLSSELDRVQKRSDGTPFRSALIVEKDFGQIVGQSIEERHGFKAQGPRRKSIARARNYLLYTALKPEHSWVYWRDVDIQDSPGKILEDFMAHNKDILVPSTYSVDPELRLLMLMTQTFGSIGMRVDGILRASVSGSYTSDSPWQQAKTCAVDYNSWIESDTGRKLADSLPKDVILAEGRLSNCYCCADSRLMITIGYKEYDTKRKYLVTLGDWRNNKDEEVELDGIGGVNILVKADVHRSG